MFPDFPSHKITEVGFVAGLQGQDVGDVTVSQSLALPSTQDGDMVTLYTRNLTINSGCTLTVSNRCKGLRIICLGNCTIAGTISMTAKGANIAGQDVPITMDAVASFVVKMPSTLEAINRYMRDNFTPISVFGDMPDDLRPEVSRTVSASTNIGTVPAAGAAGGIAQASVSPYNNHGVAGTNRKCGGGGSGGSYNSSHLGGNGGDGTAFSGGTGGGGSGGNPSTATAGSANGGAGGNGGAGIAGGGGAGNPGGSGLYSGQSGTGGLIVLIVLGNLTLQPTASIVSKGSNGGNGGTSNYAGSGGGSGGGSINIAYGGSLTTYSGYTISAAGGAGGTVGNSGGNGGAGCVTIEQVSFAG